MAEYNKAMIFGGTGATGRLVAESLARDGLDVVIAGRNGAAAQAVADDLGSRLPERVFAAAEIDVTDTAALTRALAGIDLLIVSAPVAEHMAGIGLAALDSDTDLLDILVRPLAAEKLMPLAEAARAAGRAFVTQAGFHPGVPGPMMRAAAKGFSWVEGIHVGMAMQAQFRDANSVTEIVSEVAVPTRVLDNGAWRQASYKDARDFVFGPPLGRKSCYPLNMPEIETAAAALGLRSAGVYAAGFNWFVDYVAFTLMYAAQKLGGDRLARLTTPLFYWGNRWFSPPEQCIEMRAEATGEIDGQPTKRSLSLYSADPYGLTAQCVIAAVRQMRDGPLAAPGVMLMGEAIDPERLFADLRAFGARMWEE